MIGHPAVHCLQTVHRHTDPLLLRGSPPAMLARDAFASQALVLACFTADDHPTCLNLKQAAEAAQEAGTVSMPPCMVAL